MMAEPQSKDLPAALTSTGSAPVVALVVLLATTFGVLNLSSRPDGGVSAPPAAAGAADATAASLSPG